MAAFRGFMIQGRSLTDDQPKGTFISILTDYQLHCEDHVSKHFNNDNDKLYTST